MRIRRYDLKANFAFALFYLLLVKCPVITADWYSKRLNVLPCLLLCISEWKFYSHWIISKELSFKYFFIYSLLD